MRKNVIAIHYDEYQTFSDSYKNKKNNFFKKKTLFHRVPPMEMVYFGENSDKFPENERRLKDQFIAQKVRFDLGYTVDRRLTGGFGHFLGSTWPKTVKKQRFLTKKRDFS